MNERGGNGVSITAKIANMVMARTGKGGDLLGKRLGRVEDEDAIFSREEICKTMFVAGKVSNEKNFIILGVYRGRPMRRKSVFEGLRIGQLDDIHDKIREAVTCQRWSSHLSQMEQSPVRDGAVACQR